MPAYNPPFTLTSAIVTLIANISEQLGRLSVRLEQEQALRLRRINRIRTVTGSLAIEGNTLSEAQITAILDGKRVIAPPREIQEASNALTAYEQLPHWNGHNQSDLLAAHRVLMLGLIDSAGQYRQGGVGVMAGEQVLHMAPPASQVHRLMDDLFQWLANTQEHPLISSSAFHYEFEFIHPFADGNGRIGRLWQTLLLCQWQPVFRDIPVESLIHKHQAGYYQAINDSTAQTDAAPFILFMLQRIHEALTEAASADSTPHDTPQVTPQVADLLATLKQAMNREQLQQHLGLSDRKSFRQLYLQPALAQGWIEMTLPDKPNSKNQQYRLTQAGQELAVSLKRAGEAK